MDIGFVLFPGIMQLDFTAPLQVLARMPGARTHFVAATRAPVPTDCDLPLIPNATFADQPPIDLLFVPGGGGVAKALSDSDLIAFVCDRPATARYAASVCTGAFILGRAGILKGRRATTHWAYTELLPLVGATCEPARVVRDGNIFTGGGVTAGIDLALTIVGEIAGTRTAEAIQLALEYDPEPPFTAGHPDTAPGAVKEMLTARFDASRDAMRHALA